MVAATAQDGADVLADRGPLGAETLTTRLRPLFGDEGLARLQSSRVLVFGLGGVGSSCVEALARGAVGELYLVDGDIVAPSNLNRQALAFASTLGMPKTEAMTAMIAQINPSCHVVSQHVFAMPHDMEELLLWAGAQRDRAGHVAAAGRLGYVVDAIDTMSQKLALAELCWKARVPLVSSMGAANKLRPELLEFADVSRTHGCRVARTMRKECARRGVAHLEVLYSPEEPVRPPCEAGSSHGRATRLGTASFMPPVMGQMMAGRVIRALVGAEPWRWGDASDERGAASDDAL